MSGFVLKPESLVLGVEEGLPAPDRKQYFLPERKLVRVVVYFLSEPLVQVGEFHVLLLLEVCVLALVAFVFQSVVNLLQSVV